MMKAATQCCWEGPHDSSVDCQPCSAGTYIFPRQPPEEAEERWTAKLAVALSWFQVVRGGEMLTLVHPCLRSAVELLLPAERSCHVLERVRPVE